MSDHDIDRIRHAAQSHPLLRYLSFVLTRPIIPDPIHIEFCAGDFCAEVVA